MSSLNYPRHPTHGQSPFSVWDCRYSLGIIVLAWAVILIAIGRRSAVLSGVFAPTEALDLVMLPTSADADNGSRTGSSAEILVRHTDRDGHVQEQRFLSGTGERGDVTSRRRDLCLLYGGDIAPADAGASRWRVNLQGVDGLTRVSWIDGQLDVSDAARPLQTVSAHQWSSSVHALGYVEEVRTPLTRVLAVHGTGGARLPTHWRLAFADLGDLLGLAPETRSPNALVLLEVLPDEPAFPRIETGRVDWLQYAGASPLSLEDALARPATRQLLGYRPNDPTSDGWFAPALGRLLAIHVVEKLDCYGARDRQAELFDRYVIGLHSHGSSALRRYDRDSISKSLFFENVYGPLVLSAVTPPDQETLTRWLAVQRAFSLGRPLGDAIAMEFGETAVGRLEDLVQATDRLATTSLTKMLDGRLERAESTLRSPTDRELTFFVTADTENYLDLWLQAEASGGIGSARLVAPAGA